VCGNKFYTNACPDCGYNVAMDTQNGSFGRRRTKVSSIKTSTLSAALIFGIVGLFIPVFSVPALIFAIKAKKAGEDNAQTVMAALIIAIFGLLMIGSYVLMFIIGVIQFLFG